MSFNIFAEDISPSAHLETSIDAVLTSYGAEDAQILLDTVLAAIAGEGGDFPAIAIRQRYSELDYTAYANALCAYIEKNADSLKNPVTNERIALALVAFGKKDEPFVSETADSCIGKMGIMSEVFGLHLLNNGVVSGTHCITDVIQALLEKQLPDGSWSLQGSYGDVDVTSMTLTALAANTDIPEVCSAIDAGVAWLAAAQSEAGQYQSFGNTNAESGAQVIIALSSCGIDATTDARFAKNGVNPLSGLESFRLQDGSYAHVEGGSSNAMATAQVLSAMVALWRVQNEYGNLYIFSDESCLPAYSHVSDANEMETPENSVIETSATQKTADTEFPSDNSHFSVVRWIFAGIILCGTAILLFFLRRKENRRSTGCRSTGYIIVLTCSGVLLLCVFFLRITSPEAYYAGNANVADATGEATITIQCTLVAGKEDYIPEDGIILATVCLPIADGDSVYDLLLRASQTYGIPIDVQGSKSYAYVSGIGYLYELAFGDLSGWVYRVNGVSPNVSCGAYILSDGDVVEWLYTLALGEDIPAYTGETTS